MPAQQFVVLSLVCLLQKLDSRNGSSIDPEVVPSQPVAQNQRHWPAQAAGLPSATPQVGFLDILFDTFFIFFDFLKCEMSIIMEFKPKNLWNSQDKNRQT